MLEMEQEYLENAEATREDYSVELTDSKRPFRAKISLDLFPISRTFLRKELSNSFASYESYLISVKTIRTCQPQASYSGAASAVRGTSKADGMLFSNKDATPFVNNIFFWTLEENV